MSRPDRYSQYLIMDRIQAVISFIDGYSESTDKPTCRTPMAKTKMLALLPVIIVPENNSLIILSLAADIFSCFGFEWLFLHIISAFSQVNTPQS